MYLDLLAEGGDDVIGDCRPFSSGADDVHLFLKNYHMITNEER